MMPQRPIWRVATHAHVAPFMHKVTESFIGGETLAEWQQRPLAPRGLELCELDDDKWPQELGPGLVLFDDCYFNGAALDVLLRAEDQADFLALCLAEGVLADFVASGLNADLFPSSQKALPVGLFLLNKSIVAESAQNLRQELEALSQNILLPDSASFAERIASFDNRYPTLHIPRARAIASPIHHWPHILWINQALAYADDFPRRSGPAPKSPAYKRLSHNGPASRKWQRGVVIAEGGKVHPTAYLEGCIIGAGTEIEAHASIIDSIIGQRCRITDHSSLNGCVLGDDGQTLADSMFRRVVASPQATLSNLGLEEVLIGQGSFITTASIFFTTPQRGLARFRVHDQWRDTRRPQLGGCVGQRCVLGARAIFESGLALPNNTTVVMRPEEGVRYIDPRLAEGMPACWDKGRLLPIKEVFGEYQAEELKE